MGGQRHSIQFHEDDSDHRSQYDLSYVIRVIVKGLTSVEMNKKNINHKFKSSAQHNQGRKIVIIGDSHARGWAGNMKYNVKES
jgi:hypothetical protein